MSKYDPTNKEIFKSIFDHCPRFLLELETIGMVAIKQNGAALQHVPDEMKTEEMCMTAVQQTGGALKYVPKKMKNEKMCMTAVQQDGMALQFVPNTLRTKDMCTAAVKQDGYSLKYVPEIEGKFTFRTVDMCIIAVKQNGLALQFVPENLITKNCTQLNKITNLLDMVKIDMNNFSLIFQLKVLYLYFL